MLVGDVSAIAWVVVGYFQQDLHSIDVCSAMETQLNQYQRVQHTYLLSRPPRADLSIITILLANQSGRNDPIICHSATSSGGASAM